MTFFVDSHSVLFMSIFTIGLLGVIVFYIWKKSNGRWSFGPSRYQYSVLNTSLMEHYDESSDPLMNDIGRNDENGDNNFLDISRYQYSDDDDVELLGVSLKENTFSTFDTYSNKGSQEIKLTMTTSLLCILHLSFSQNLTLSWDINLAFPLSKYEYLILG